MQITNYNFDNNYLILKIVHYKLQFRQKLSNIKDCKLQITISTKMVKDWNYKLPCSWFTGIAHSFDKVVSISSFYYDYDSYLYHYWLALVIIDVTKPCRVRCIYWLFWSTQTWPLCCRPTPLLCLSIWAATRCSNTNQFKWSSNGEYTIWTTNTPNIYHYIASL